MSSKPSSKPAGRDNDSSSSLPLLLALLVVAAVVTFRNQSRLQALLQDAMTTMTDHMPAIVTGAVSFTAVFVVASMWLAAVRRRRAAKTKLGDKHLAALRQVGLAKNLTDVDGTPVFIKPERTVDPDGTERITYALPDGVSAGQVAATGDRFIAALKLPVHADRVSITAHNGLAHRLAITIEPPPLKLTERHPQPPVVTHWADPVLLGRDKRTGLDITAPTWDVPAWLVGGRSGSGKSVALRILIAHYAADPDAILWGFDAKGSTDDWADIRPRFAEWVTTKGDTNVDGPLLIETLRRLDQEVFRRNEERGRFYPGLLVLLEEITSLRDDMSPKDRAILDGLLGRLVKTCRSANTTLVLTAQRPSHKDLPTTVRAQAEVLLCMRMTRASDASMVLGEQPDYDVSSFPDGHGLISVKGNLRPLVVDFFDDDAWALFCDRFAPDQEAQDGPQDGPYGAQTASEPQTLLSACVAIVARSESHELQPTALFQALAEEIRPTSVRALAVELKRLGWSSRPPRKVAGVATRFYNTDDVTDAVTDTVTQGTDQGPVTGSPSTKAGNETPPAYPDVLEPPETMNDAPPEELAS